MKLRQNKNKIKLREGAKIIAIPKLLEICQEAKDKGLKGYASAIVNTKYVPYAYDFIEAKLPESIVYTSIEGLTEDQFCYYQIKFKDSDDLKTYQSILPEVEKQLNL